MNILVLGGTGYLGEKIAKMFSADGHRVVATVRSNTIRANEKTNYVMIPASVDAIETEFMHAQYDLIINAVCNYGRNSNGYMDVISANMCFPLEVLDIAARYNVKKYITVGTGLPDNLNIYSFSKSIFNEYGRFYSEKNNVTFISLNLEMFYGTDEPSNRFLPGLIRKMIKGEEINVTLGTQKRDIIAVQDVLCSVKEVANSDIIGYKEISIGTGESPTISDIVDYLWEVTGKKSIVNKGAIPMRDNEPDSVADITDISKLTDWKPMYWKDGLKEMITNIQEKEEEE